ncbi:MAG: hypothetical protein KIT56_01310 [Gammaproteobacteria bacterium]|nr:hypothetical protein [Gammaproteobacteria bacterium]MCW5582523.1 hypothetical protein [Gammaproteobacteria bacterium]
MFKKYIAISTLFISFPMYAAELTTYKAIEQSLTEGNLITMVMRYNACEVNNPNPFIIKVGSAVFKPQVVLLSDDGYLAAEGTWFTTGFQNGAGNGINQHYKIILNNQNQLKVTLEFFNADTGKRSDIKNVDVNCELGKGIKVYGHKEG